MNREDSFRPGASPVDLPSAPPLGVRLRVGALRFQAMEPPVLADLALDLAPGTWTCLLGPSGVGKTTLLRLVAGLLGPHVSPDTHVQAEDGAPLAGRVAWMAQQDLLLPWLSVLDNACLGARLRGEAPDLPRARALLAEAGLAEVIGRRPAALSGGQRQRVALVRTLLENRPLILMDEPFSALDPPTRLRLQDVAARLLAGRTVLLVTHDPMEALRLGHRVHVLSGSPARLGPPLVLPGPAPRSIHDPEVMARHVDLLDQLAEAVP